MRLRTLPLSTAGVLLGILLAVADWKVDPWTAVLIVLTTICLQILSNLSNELGDVLQGTDTAERQGPQYGLNGGGLTLGEMKRLIGTFVGLCIVFGTAMTWRAFGTLMDLTPILVLLLGAGAIVAAMRYTLGPNPYGYRAKGDFYVFIFLRVHFLWAGVCAGRLLCVYQRLRPALETVAAGRGRGLFLRGRAQCEQHP